MATEVRCGGLLFTSKFDSGNLARVEKVDRSDSDSDTPHDPYGCRIIPDYEFNVWTKPDCGGTPFENGNRSWFYFGIRGNNPNKVIKINIVNLNRQGKLYSQGMSPMVKVIPSKPKWERIRDRATYQFIDGQFTLSFTYRFSEQKGGTTYFSFCFPWSYTESQEQLEILDQTFPNCADLRPGQMPNSGIYYHREVACYSLDKRKIDLITITSCKGMCAEREPRLENLFPEKSVPRPHKFLGKRVYYVSSRVHPGETPASFVFNGFLEFALRENDARAQVLRDKYIIKLVPMLNPDGVYRGHYRTDQRGVNLNRLYLNPDFRDHPSIYASRTLLLFYHHYYRTKEQSETVTKQNGTGDSAKIHDNTGNASDDDVIVKKKTKDNVLTSCFGGHKKDQVIKEPRFVPFQGDYTSIPPRESGLAFYVDLHGHASKRGCFIYGNHLEIEEDQVDNLLFPKLISLNSAHFDFNGCNFTERNMYLKDKRDGMSKEGSGRVAIFKTTGIMHSYTLECNYNTGRTVNCIASGGNNGRATPPPQAGFPPKYTPEIFEGVGRAMAIAALDFYGCNPWSRLKQSEFTSLENLRHWMTRYVRSSRGNPILPRKMTTRIPITTPNMSNGTASSNGSSNGSTKMGSRLNGSNDVRKNAPVSVYRNNNNVINNTNGNNKRVVAATKNQLSPFKSMSTSSVGNMQGSNRFTNRQKSLIRVTVNNNGRTVKTGTDQSQIRPTKPLQPFQKNKTTQETQVTLSFTTTNAGEKNKSQSGNTPESAHLSNQATFPSVMENLSHNMDERLLICLRALESPSFPHSIDGTMAPYGSPNFNSLQNSHFLRTLTPPLHRRSVPPHIHHNIIMKTLSQEYSSNDFELPLGDAKSFNDFTRQHQSLLGQPGRTNKPQNHHSHHTYPKFKEPGFITPKVTKPPSFASKGKGSLSMDDPLGQNIRLGGYVSEQIGLRNGGAVPYSGSFHNIAPTTRPIILTINGAESHLPLTVTRKPIMQSKDENENYVPKTNSEIYIPSTRPTIVNFKPHSGLISEHLSAEVAETPTTPVANKRVSRLRPPRKISSGKSDFGRRGSGTPKLSAKSGVDKELRYLKTPKSFSGRNSRNAPSTQVSGPVLSGEALHLTPRAPKTVLDDSSDNSHVAMTNIESPNVATFKSANVAMATSMVTKSTMEPSGVTIAPDATANVSRATSEVIKSSIGEPIKAADFVIKTSKNVETAETKTTSPTAINANLMMMNCSPVARDDE